MLKISIQDEPNLVTMKLEGSLAGTWVIELEDSWRAVKPEEPVANSVSTRPESSALIPPAGTYWHCCATAEFI